MAGPCFGEVPRKTYRCGDELIAVAKWFLKTTFFPPSCRVMTSGVTRALVNHGCGFFFLWEVCSVSRQMEVPLEAPVQLFLLSCI